MPLAFSSYLQVQKPRKGKRNEMSCGEISDVFYQSHSSEGRGPWTCNLCKILPTEIVWRRGIRTGSQSLLMELFPGCSDGSVAVPIVPSSTRCNKAQVTIAGTIYVISHGMLCRLHLPFAVSGVCSDFSYSFSKIKCKQVCSFVIPAVMPWEESIDLSRGK